jgi:hypothetical protein
VFSSVVGVDGKKSCVGNEALLRKDDIILYYSIEGGKK